MRTAVAEAQARFNSADAAHRDAIVCAAPLRNSYAETCREALRPSIDAAFTTIRCKVNKIDRLLGELDDLHAAARQAHIDLRSRPVAGAAAARAILASHFSKIVDAWR